VNALHSEWTKFRTVRSTGWTLVAIVALPIAVAILVAATGSLQPTETVLAGAVGNSVVGQVAAGILGVLVVAGEYGTGTIGPTLAARPGRTPVLAAKAVLVAGLTFVVALAGNAAGLAVAGAMLDGHRLGQPWPALLGVAAGAAAVGVLGVGLGFLLRHTAGAVTAVVAVLLLPILIGPLLGPAAARVTGLAPASAVQKLVDPDVVHGSPGAGVTLLMVWAYCLVVLAAGAGRLRRSDVT
jgi:ABC-2 type transport system permease protein